MNMQKLLIKIACITFCIACPHVIATEQQSDYGNEFENRLENDLNANLFTINYPSAFFTIHREMVTMPQSDSWVKFGGKLENYLNAHLFINSYPSAFFIPPRIMATEKQPDYWLTFGGGLESNYHSSVCTISYPAAFFISPESGIVLPNQKFLFPLTEENYHWLIIHNYSGTLTIKASSYSYICKDTYVPRGFTSPKEVILTDYFRNAWYMTISKREGYEIIRSIDNHRAKAFFLNTKADWGSCVESIQFIFHKGTSFEDHVETINTVIDNFIPIFIKYRNRE